MPCRPFLTSNQTTSEQTENVCINHIGYLCGPKLYLFPYNGKAYFFEVHSYMGPWPLRKDGELKKRIGRKFWEMYDHFLEIEPSEREEFRV